MVVLLDGSRALGSVARGRPTIPEVEVDGVRRCYRPAMGSAVRVWAPPSVLVVLIVLETHATRGDASSRAIVVMSLLLLAAAGLAWRRSRPVAATVAASSLVAGALLLQDDPAAQPPLGAFLVMLVAFFSLGLHAREQELPLGLAASGLPLLAVELAAVAAGRPVLDIVPTLLFWSTAVMLGRLLHRRAHEAEVERRRADAAERLAADAAASERARIAREIHDVVAHSLSVVVLHAGVERRLVTDRSSSSYQALETIERTGRTALSELRHLLGLLHKTDEATALAPLPSLHDLDTLCETLRLAGHPVTVEVTGAQGDLPDGVALSAYRIVQEAVTNAIKHAPGASVAVQVAHRSDAVLVEVTNTEAAPRAPRDPGPSAVPGAGRGLAGMRERVRVYGGSLTAAALPSGGFRVRAELPREAG
jgi:signal transduction histidine kinase